MTQTVFQPYATQLHPTWLIQNVEFTCVLGPEGTACRRNGEWFGRAMDRGSDHKPLGPFVALGGCITAVKEDYAGRRP